ncbi:MAG: transglycosylase SLT domain-containing protein [Candidatus Rokubacteria bacterium]|nr:transglycosylase SLT domain-containing protein [Candidatus Rokubacteria bacterium]
MIDGGARAPSPIDHAPSATGSSEDAGSHPSASQAYPVVLNAQVQHFLDRFTRERREIVAMWLNRSSRYLGMIREVLKSRGMPEDLAFTAMIESGFNPVAVSRAGAVGLWQFMATTARRYGLRVDDWVDERLDPEKSTFAAAAYLRDLYQQFGSWTLAQAAYNAGENSVVRAMRASGANDFWALSRTRFLPKETKEFIPQIAAATLIGRDPVQYGFPMAETTVTSFETISVPPSTDLRWLAATSGISVDMLRSMNPTLVRGMTPPGRAHELRVPLGTGPGVLAALDAPRPRVTVARAHARGRSAVARAASKPAAPVAVAREPRVVRAARSQTTAAATSDVHVVRPRDTVTSIAKQYGLSVGTVLRWNSLEKHDRIRPGDRLRLTERQTSSDRPSGVR